MGRGKNTWFCQGLPIAHQHASGHWPRVADHRPSALDSKLSRTTHGPRPHLRTLSTGGQHTNEMQPLQSNQGPTSHDSDADAKGAPPACAGTDAAPPGGPGAGGIDGAAKPRVRAVTPAPWAPAGVLTGVVSPTTHTPHDQAMVPPPPEECFGPEGLSAASLLPQTDARPGGQNANATHQVRRGSWRGHWGLGSKS